MKKLLFTAALAVLGFTSVNAQEDNATNQTAKGKWLIEANTGNAMLGTTGIYFASIDGESTYNVGLDGGYFIMDDLALKAGIGFGGIEIRTQKALTLLSIFVYILSTVMEENLTVV